MAKKNQKKINLKIKNISGKRFRISYLKDIANRFFDKNNIFCAQVVIYLMDDTLISETNYNVFGKSETTDVITVPFEENGCLEAEIYLGVEEIKRNTLEYGTSFSYELAFCLVHGLLHAVGWVDDTDEKRQRMLSWQQEFLRENGFE